MNSDDIQCEQRFIFCRAPDYFDESWLTKIKPDVSTNWRLKVSKNVHNRSIHLKRGHRYKKTWYKCQCDNSPSNHNL